MKKKFLLTVICFVLLVCLTLGGCDMMSALRGDNAVVSPTGAIETLPPIEVDMTKGFVDIGSSYSFKINSCNIYKSLEEAGYASFEDENITVRDDRLSVIEEYENPGFLTLDVSFLYTNSGNPGALIKNEFNNLSGMLRPYFPEDDGTKDAIWEHILIFDYKVVDGGERYATPYTYVFDMIEGQELNFKLVYDFDLNSYDGKIFLKVNPPLTDPAYDKVYITELDVNIEDYK